MQSRLIKDDITSSYYKLVNDKLVQIPMLSVGSMGNNKGREVDWSFVAMELPMVVNGKEYNIYEHLMGIKNKLIEEMINKD